MPVPDLVGGFEIVSVPAPVATIFVPAGMPAPAICWPTAKVPQPALSESITVEPAKSATLPKTSLGPAERVRVFAPTAAIVVPSGTMAP